MGRDPLRIVGQGLAGSLLAWECERAGIPFRIFERPENASASQVAAGILNPITGQRVVKSWRVDALLPLAVETYRNLEHTLGEALLHPMRVRRLFRDDREREVARDKFSRGELSPYVSSLQSDGFWIDSAYHLDSRKLVERLRQRWLDQSILTCAGDVADGEKRVPGPLTVWCIGAGELGRSHFSFAQLQAAKGQILGIASEAIEPGVVLNDGHWLLPVGRAQARVGATFERGETSLALTDDARSTLETAARRLLRADFEVTGHDAGVRVTTPDKHPIVGRHPRDAACGIINGLGSKGGLLAPWLAQQWVAHIERGMDFDPAVDVKRFAR